MHSSYIKQGIIMKQMEHSYKGEEKFLVNDLKTIVSKARSKAFAAVNYSLVERNWRIGKRIVEEEQNGEARAEYGKHIIEVASAALTEEFGKGFSETNLINFKKFFLLFKELEIHQTVSEEFRKQVLHLLPWSHYERLIRVEDKKAREWYAKEAPFQKGQAVPDLFYFIFRITIHLSIKLLLFLA